MDRLFNTVCSIDWECLNNKYLNMQLMEIPEESYITEGIVEESYEDKYGKVYCIQMELPDEYCGKEFEIVLIPKVSK